MYVPSDARRGRKVREVNGNIKQLNVKIAVSRRINNCKQINYVRVKHENNDKNNKRIVIIMINSE